MEHFHQFELYVFLELEARADGACRRTDGRACTRGSHGNRDADEPLTEADEMRVNTAINVVRQ